MKPVLATAISLVFLASYQQAAPQVEPQAGVAAFLDCVRENEFAMLAAHPAGPAAGAPENSLAALRRSAGLGSVFVEVDVAQTSDGVLVLLHDRTLDRTTTGTGTLIDFTYPELSEIRLVDPDGVATGEPVPTLASALELAGALGLYLELDLKSVPVDAVAETVEAAGLTADTVLIAYNVEAVASAWAISAPNDIAALDAAGVPRDRLLVWLGLGQPDAGADAELAEMAIESGAGLFRLENGDPEVYTLAAATGVELLSVDDVQAASDALGGAEVLNGQISQCRPRS
jgi:glycerophosphoryl diester phosphodiesterase